ncbi:MAG TPA: SDR family NAD(P)-dependent oxidoreductase, partial [Anaerolineae bacterium]
MAKVALVTGASRGIGRGIATLLAQHGWSIVLNYRNNHQAADVAAQEIQSTGAQTLVLQADVGSIPGRELLVAQTLERFGQIDLLVNNAGMGPRQRLDLLDVTEASYNEVMDTNLKGPFFLTQRVAKAMLVQMQSSDQRGLAYSPSIVNIGSISAYTSSINRAEYCLSKAGVAMMTKLFADRLAQTGIRVYEIRPGIIETDMT